MDPALITAWAAMAMAGAAFFGQALATWINGRYTIKLRKIELDTQRFNDAVASFAATYGKLSESIYADDFSDFMASAHLVLSVVQNPKIHKKVIDLIELISANGKVSDESNKPFRQIMSDIAIISR